MKAALLALAACSAPTPMVIAVTGESAIGREAIEAWGVLGFTYTDGPADITIHVTRAPYTSPDCSCRVLGHADGHEVTIDPLLEGDHLRHVARHEFGHVLLQSLHLESYINPTWGTWGIMRGQPTWLLEPTPDDLAMACYTINVCPRP